MGYGGYGMGGYGGYGMGGYGGYGASMLGSVAMGRNLGSIASSTTSPFQYSNGANGGYGSPTGYGGYNTGYYGGGMGMNLYPGMSMTPRQRAGALGMMY